jgi:hypothetical protein
VVTTAKPWPLSAAVLSRSMQRKQAGDALTRRTQGGSMPLIKPRTRGKQLVRHITRLDRETNETLFAYAQFLGEPTDYVLNQVIDTVLAKDKDFLGWRAEHPGSFVPRAGHRSHRSKRSVGRQPVRPEGTLEVAAIGSANG